MLYQRRTGFSRAQIQAALPVLIVMALLMM